MRALSVVSSVGLILLAAGCGNSDASGPPPLGDPSSSSGHLTITASATSAPADGHSAITLTITGSTKGPIVVTTTLGTLAGNGSMGSSISLATDGTATISTCDASAGVAGCTGSATITAKDADNHGATVKVSFSGKEDCTNKADDDGNGLVDCKDVASCPTGSACGNGSTCKADGTCASCAPSVGDPESPEKTCTDGGDNDCDGKIDCADTDCDGKACSTGSIPSGVCKAGTCQCGTSGEDCANGMDDDCDGLVDCADADDCAAGVACQGAGKTCTTDATCAVCHADPGFATETKEVSCKDGGDNDCDGLIDCADPDCDAAPCSIPTVPAGTCKFEVCACSSAGQEDCTNGIDDDCNGKVDCNDTACLGAQCGSAVSQICQKDVGCVDTETAYVLTVTPDRGAIPADGLANDGITIKLANGSGGVVAKQTITLALTGAGTLIDPATTMPATSGSITLETDETGIAKASLASVAAGGTATLTATYGTGSGEITGVGNVRMPTAGSFAFLAPQYTVLGVRSSGYQEQGQLTFQLLDDTKNPYPAGLAVTISHKPFGGSTIGPPKQDLCTDPGCTITVKGVTDDQGRVTATLYSGTVAGTVTVSIDATAGGASTHLDSPTIPIVGAKANGSHVSVVCTPSNVAAFPGSDCQKSKLDQPITCTVALADRFNNVLGIAASVSMLSEGGTVGQPSSTPAPGASGVSGQAQIKIQTLGGVLPIDVPPQFGEPSRVVDDLTLDPCGNGKSRVHNPRDGAVSVVAYTQGEEGYVDQNANGQHDDGEPFIDLAEPFIDADDSGDHNNDEDYKDVNGNNQWDGPNHQWDANTTIWAETRITFSDIPQAVIDSANKDVYSRFFPLLQVNGVTPPDPTTEPFVSVANNAAVTVGVGFTDLNFLPLAFDATFGSPSVAGNGVSPTFSGSFAADHPEGYLFKERYCNGAVGGDGTVCDLVCPPKFPDGTSVVECVPRGDVSDYAAFSRNLLVLKGTSVAGWKVTVSGTSGTKTTGRTQFLDLSGQTE